ncbi:MAG: hypothetical protein R3D46_06180 [Defluviimonas denitrificans]
MALSPEKLGVSAEHVISNCDLCINGTTVGLNALIQHKGEDQVDLHRRA